MKAMNSEVTPRTQILTVGDWSLGRTLGRGAYAHVRVATHTNGHTAACKILPALHRSRNTPATWDETVDAIEAHKEVILLKALSGAGIPGVVGLEGVIEEGGWTYVFLTLYELSASAVITPWPRELLIPYFRKLLHTVHALHSLDISHEDLKRSNVLLDRSCQPIVVDFGFSHFKPGGGYVRSAGGTLDYSSPEKVMDQLYDPKANDVWALGILLTKIVGVGHPFLSGDIDEPSQAVKTRIIKGNPFFHWHMEDLLPGGLAELLHGMLHKDPLRRLTIPEVLRHPYLSIIQPDRKQYRPPSLHLPAEVPSPLPYTVLEDICFLAYLDQSFCLCETPKKIKDRILGSESCWEKRWAGLLCRWKKREDLEWQDIVKVATRTSTLHKAKRTLQPQPLREIYLSPNVATKTGQTAETKIEGYKPSRKSLIKQMKGKEGSVSRVSPAGVRKDVQAPKATAMRRKEVNLENFPDQSAPGSTKQVRKPKHKVQASLISKTQDDPKLRAVVDDVVSLTQVSDSTRGISQIITQPDRHWEEARSSTYDDSEEQSVAPARVTQRGGVRVANKVGKKRAPLRGSSKVQMEQDQNEPAGPSLDAARRSLRLKEKGKK